jgi:hypothetical protein
MQSILVAMMKSFSCSPLILVCRETQQQSCTLGCSGLPAGSFFWMVELKVRRKYEEIAAIH